MHYLREDGVMISVMAPGRHISAVRIFFNYSLGTRFSNSRSEAERRPIVSPQSVQVSLCNELTYLN